MTEEWSLEVRAHHLGMHLAAVREGIPKAVDSIVAISKNQHRELVGADGTTVNLRRDYLGENDSGEQAYKEGLYKFFSSV